MCRVRRAGKHGGRCWFFYWKIRRSPFEGMVVSLMIVLAPSQVVRYEISEPSIVALHIIHTWWFSQILWMLKMADGILFSVTCDTQLDLRTNMHTNVSNMFQWSRFKGKAFQNNLITVNICCSGISEIWCSLFVTSKLSESCCDPHLQQLLLKWVRRLKLEYVLQLQREWKKPSAWDLTNILWTWIRNTE